MPRHGTGMSGNATRDNTKVKQWAVVAERREVRELEECQTAIKILKDKIEAARKSSQGGGKDDYDASAELKSLKAELKDEQKKVSPDCWLGGGGGDGGSGVAGAGRGWPRVARTTDGLGLC